MAGRSSGTPSTSGQVVVPAPDGRQLAVRAWGDPEGAPLLMLHGSPGSRFLRHPGRGYLDHHLRVITYDRPGYGMSTRVPVQTMADAARDIEVIADVLGLDRFGVLGVSGGGPRALAAAALLPDRVTRCATVVSGAPFTADDIDFYAGMDADSQAGWEAAREGGDLLDADCAEALEWVRSGLPGIVFDTDEHEEMLRETFEEAFRQGVVGFRDDRLATVRDWGFSVGDVKVPTKVMVARDDSSVPVTHWDWMMAHLPEGTLVPVDGDHFGPREGPEMQLVAWVGHGR